MMKFAVPRNRCRTRGLVAPAIACLAVIAFSLACSTLPKQAPEKTESFGLEPTTDGVLADVTNAIRSKNSGEHSGFSLLDSNEEALRWRLALADSAQSTLDAQYFIWHGDASGLLLLSRVLDAADRGVRVRLLIDDLMMGGAGKIVAALCNTPKSRFESSTPGTCGPVAAR